MKIDPVKHEFQGRDGKWYPFMDDAHYQNTVEDGPWLIRALYTEAQLRQAMEACAAACFIMDEYVSKDDCAGNIPHLIREMLR